MNKIKKNVNIFQVNCYKQNRSTEGYSKLKSPETRQVQERLVSTLEHMPKVGQEKVSGIKWYNVSSMEGVTVYGHPPELRVIFGRGEPHIVW